MRRAGTLPYRGSQQQVSLQPLPWVSRAPFPPQSSQLAQFFSQQAAEVCPQTQDLPLSPPLLTLQESQSGSNYQLEPKNPTEHWTPLQAEHHQMASLVSPPG